AGFGCVLRHSPHVPRPLAEARVPRRWARPSHWSGWGDGAGRLGPWPGGWGVCLDIWTRTRLLIPLDSIFRTFLSVYMSVSCKVWPPCHVSFGPPSKKVGRSGEGFATIF